jgi:hypothetical protein
MVHPQETSVSKAPTSPTPALRPLNAPEGIFGQPLPRTKKPAEPRQARERTPEADKRLDRMFAFYEHMAPDAEPAEIRWRHAYWSEKRQKVRTALSSTGTSEKALHNFDNCGSYAVTEWSDSLQRRRLKSYTCRCRHCEPCARTKANRIAAALREKLGGDAGVPRRDGVVRRERFGTTSGPGAQRFRFITLTLKHSDAPLADQIKRLYRSFKKLRSFKPWKKSQRGGAFILEVKHNGRHWHPHLHVISDGNFIDKELLSKLWHKATGDSYIIDIRQLSRTNDVAAYVAKYITKSTSDSVWNDPDRAQEWVIASKGVRTCATFGSWRGFALLKKMHQANDWQPEARLIVLLAREKNGDQVARDILNNLRPLMRVDDVHWTDEDFPPTFIPPPA